jgi:hypothetical protein
LDTLSGKHFFTTLDCFAGYWQVPLHPDSRKFTAFITPFGVYEFTVLSFGLTNAPACFSRILSGIFSDYRPFVTIYLDDMAVHSLTFNEHIDHLRLVFQRLADHQIRLKLKKCCFLQSSFRYLGFLISADGLHPDPKKTATLLDLPVPSNVSQVRSFLGLASYFRRFIADFSPIAEPLQALTRRAIPFLWTDQCQRSFDTLRQSLISAPVLRHPDPLRPFILSTDASDLAIGAVLEQEFADGQLHPVYYASRHLTSAERNYSVHEREALAVVTFVKKFRCYLLGSTFLVYTDNVAITYLLKQREPTGRIARWICTLSEYNFEVRHRSGKSNIVADFLSRPFPLVAAVSSSLPISFEDILKFLRDDVPPAINDSRFRRMVRRFIVLDGLLYRRNKTVPLRVLCSLSELHQVLTILHDQLGHFAFNTVWLWVRQRYWRPHLYAEVRHFVASCSSCQRYQLSRPAYSFNGQSAISGFGHWYLDVLGPFPTSTSGMVCIFTAIEALTAFPIATAFPAQTGPCARAFLLDIISLFGVPSSVSTDGGPCFISSPFRSLFTQFDIPDSLSLPYQPEWHGMIERLNSTIRYAITKTCSSDFSNWPSVLPQILLGIRSRPSARTGYSPAYLLFGFQPRLPFDHPSFVGLSVSTRTLELTPLPAIRHSLCRPATPSTLVTTFALHSFVLALVPALRMRKSHRKVSPRYLGPFQVIKILPHNLYQVRSESSTVHTFHASRLIAFVPRFLSQSSPLGGECQA